jgi:hypothetical protein
LFYTTIATVSDWLLHIFVIGFYQLCSSVGILISFALPVIATFLNDQTELNYLNEIKEEKPTQNAIVSAVVPGLVSWFVSIVHQFASEQTLPLKAGVDGRRMPWHIAEVTRLRWCCGEHNKDRWLDLPWLCALNE